MTMSVHVQMELGDFILGILGRLIRHRNVLGGLFSGIGHDFFRGIRVRLTDLGNPLSDAGLQCAVVPVPDGAGRQGAQHEDQDQLLKPGR